MTSKSIAKTTTPPTRPEPPTFPRPLTPDGRYLSRTVDFNDRAMGLSYVEIAAGRVKVEPYDGERHSTRLVDHITVTAGPDMSVKSIKIT